MLRGIVYWSKKPRAGTGPTDRILAERFKQSITVQSMTVQSGLKASAAKQHLRAPAVFDLYNREARYNAWLKKIQDDTRVFSENDREDIQRFIVQMGNDGLSLLRRIKYFSFLYQIKGHLKEKSFREATREDIENLVKEMEGNVYKTQDSIQSFRALLKRFYRFLLGNDEEFPDQVKFVTRRKIRKEIRDEEDIQREYLSEEEIERVVAMAASIQSKSIMGVGYESEEGHAITRIESNNSTK